MCCEKAGLRSGSVSLAIHFTHPNGPWFLADEGEQTAPTPYLDAASPMSHRPQVPVLLEQDHHQMLRMMVYCTTTVQAYHI